MITVAPVADAPDVTGVDLTVPEADAEQTLYPDVTAEVTDTDGSETLVELRALGVTGYDFRVNGDVVTLAELAAYGPVTFEDAGNGGTLDVTGSFTLDMVEGEVVFTITTPGVTSFDLNGGANEHFGIIIPANDHPSFEVTFKATSQEGSDTDNRATGSTVIDVVVTPVNDAPIADDDTATVAEDSIDNAIDVFANDEDIDGDEVTITAVTQGTHGSVEFTADGVTYTPDPDYFGPDSFTYTISDGNGGTDTATVTVTVTNVNDDPVANDDTATVDEDSADNEIEVLANDNDGVDTGETLTVTAVSDPAHGTVTISPDGLSVLYTPDPNFAGADSFTYTVSDGNGGTDTATVNVTVLNVDSDFQGTNGDDVFLVRRDPTGTNIEVYDNEHASGTPIFSAPYASVDNLSFDMLAGDDRLDYLLPIRQPIARGWNDLPRRCSRHDR